MLRQLKLAATTLTRITTCRQPSHRLATPLSFQPVAFMSDSHPAEAVLKGHYASPGIREKIQAGLEQLGKTVETVAPGDIKMMDEFHMGGAPATMHFLESMDLNDGDAVLDVGCGIGGPCRTIASNFKVASIDGIDLTPEYIELGNEMNSWPLVRETFLGGVCPTLAQGSALSLPYADASFTKIVMLHVGMNIEDKAQLFRELSRVLKAGGKVGVFDVMRFKDVELPFPMPWSSKPETSFVQTPANYLACMEAAGLVPMKLDNRREAILDQLAKQVAAMKDGAAKNPLQLGILLGDTAPQKGANISGKVKECVIGPVELICSKL